MTDPLADFRPRSLIARIRARDLSARDLLEEVRSRMEAAAGLRAFLHPFASAAAVADRIDERIARGLDPGRLAGLPVAVKANIAVAGEITSCGSRLLESYRPPRHAHAIERLLAEGAVLVGSTNMDEFGMGSSTENSAMGPARNPWAPDRCPGGSSGGSAAAVASRTVPCALGSDTGGSIRQPAAFCGVTGLLPTWGRVSRSGLVAYGSSFDAIGPITVDAEDAALLLDVIAGKDPADATSFETAGRDWMHPVADPARGLRVALVREWQGDGIDPRVRDVVRRAADRLAGAGATIEEIALPSSRHAIAAYYVVACAEASSNLARFSGTGFGRRGSRKDDISAMIESTRDEGFGAEVKRRILLGTFALSAGHQDAYYGRAMRVRGRISTEMNAALAEHDVLLGPTTPTPAFRLGEKVEDPLAMYAADLLTVSANLAGLPAISVPAGFVEEAGRMLPVGIQFHAAPGREDRVLRAALAFQGLDSSRREEPPR